MITITDKAKNQLLKFKAEQEAEEKAPNLNLRIGVIPGGCSGFSYKLHFDNATQEGDQEFAFGDLKVAVDSRSATFLAGTTLDFHDGLDGSGFTFENPNAVHSCGCGKSFGN